MYRIITIVYIRICVFTFFSLTRLFSPSFNQNKHCAIIFCVRFQRTFSPKIKKKTYNFVSFHELFREPVKCKIHKSDNENRSSVFIPYSSTSTMNPDPAPGSTPYPMFCQSPVINPIYGSGVRIHPRVAVCHV